MIKALKSNPLQNQGIIAVFPVDATKESINVSVSVGDITRQNVEAIVCPSNPLFDYTRFGGINLAISYAAGSAPFKEADKIVKERTGSELYSTEVGIPMGQAVVTGPGNLTHLKGMIHVNNNVSYMSHGSLSGDTETVKLSTMAVLREAEEAKFESVAFPTLGTGETGLSVTDSLEGMRQGIAEHFNVMNGSTYIKRISIVLDPKSFEREEESMRRMMSDALRK